MRRLAVAAASVLTVFSLAGAAHSATIQDLRALGYTVTMQFQTPTCTAWTVSGYGMTNNGLGCEGTPDFQATVDSMANPVAHCNRVWQSTHPEQLAALDTIRRKGYAVSGDQCADIYTVSNQYTAVVVYSGPGAGLVQLAATIEPAQPPVVTTTGGGGQTATEPVVTTCLPLCPTPPAPESTAATTPTAEPQAGTTSVSDPGTGTIATEPTVATGSVVSTLTVTVGTVAGARAVPVEIARGSLLATTLTLALGRTVRILPTTVCAVGTSRVPCSRLVKYMDGRKVRVRATAAGAQRITIIG